MLVGGNDQLAQLVHHREFIGGEKAMSIALSLSWRASFFWPGLWQRRSDNCARRQFHHLATADSRRLPFAPSPRHPVTPSPIFLLRHYRFPFLNSSARSSHERQATAIIVHVGF